MESTKFPKIKFIGKIVDPLDFTGSFSKEVFLKGKLTLHGVTKEVIFKTTIVKMGSKITSKSKFEIQLSDYNIKIPSIVNQKIANVITIFVTTEMQPKSS